MGQETRVPFFCSLCYEQSSLGEILWSVSSDMLPRTFVDHIDVKIPLFLSDFNQRWNVSAKFSETAGYQRT